MNNSSWSSQIMSENARETTAIACMLPVSCCDPICPIKRWADKQKVRCYNLIHRGKQHVGESAHGHKKGCKGANFQYLGNNKSSGYTSGHRVHTIAIHVMNANPKIRISGAYEDYRLRRISETTSGAHFY